MLSLASIKVDVTPGLNGIIGFLPVKDMLPPRDSLFARLFLLEVDNQRILLVSLDYGGLYCSVQAEWQRRLGDVLGIPTDNVLIHCEHQHDAPFIFKEAAEKLEPGMDWSWVEPIISSLENAASQLPNRLKCVKRLGWSETRLPGYASNRRVSMPDGRIAIRYSRCGEPEVRNQPTGIIDPMLRTLGFYSSENELIAAWSFYATHPQVANEGLRYSSDAPGEAMRQMEERFPQAMCAFFNGCFGNVTAGKFSSPTELEWNISHFGSMLADGITRNLAAQEMYEAELFAWTSMAFPFPAVQFTDEELNKRDCIAPTIAPVLRAIADFYKDSGESFIMKMLTLGKSRIIFFSGELFIEYQLYLQGLILNEKLAVVGNCGDDALYVGTKEALSEPGGYETQSFCRVKPEFERLFKDAAIKLLFSNNEKVNNEE